jgi:hypothetical protein
MVSFVFRCFYWSLNAVRKTYALFGHINTKIVPFYASFGSYLANVTYLSPYLYQGVTPFLYT